MRDDIIKVFGSLHTWERRITILLLTLALILATVGIAKPQTTNTITLTASPPSGVTSISATVVNGIGNGTFYYWIVAIYPKGKVISRTPAMVTNVPATLSAGTYIRVSWQGDNRATGYDVLRTTTSLLPSGTGNWLKTANTSTLTYNDISSATPAGYTITGFGTTTYSQVLDNGSFPESRVIPSGDSPIVVFPNGIKINNNSITQPTCSVIYRGVLWYTYSALGVADTVEVCNKDAANVYAWSMSGGGGAGTVDIKVGGALVGTTGPGVGIDILPGLGMACNGLLPGDISITCGLEPTMAPILTVAQTDQHKFCLDAGLDDDYSCNVSPVLATYSNGQTFSLRVTTPNTDGATVDLGPGVIALNKPDGTPLTTGDIEANRTYDFTIYTGTPDTARLLSSGSNGGKLGLETCIFDAAGGLLTTSIEPCIVIIPSDGAGTLTRWEVRSISGTPIAGTITIEIERASTVNWPTFSSITGTGTKPNISGSDTIAESNIFTNWGSITVAGRDALRMSITAVTNITKAVVLLEVTK